MQYTLIKGNFHVVGYSPDGDSIMFKAANENLWKRLSTEENRELFEEKLRDPKNRGAVQLRLQGIDALETHYKPEPLPTPTDLKTRETKTIAETRPRPKEFNQLAEIGVQAAEAFMRFLGVQKVEWDTVYGSGRMVRKASLARKNGNEEWVTAKQADVIPGYIVASDVERNCRPLAWVFAGTSSDKDGASLSQDQLMARVDQSANYYLLKRGLVYPYYFMTLAGGLRGKLTEAAKLAQKAATKIPATPTAPLQGVYNVWAYDKTAQGVKISTLKQVTEDTVVLPYLFRKVIKSWYRQNMQQYWDALSRNGKFSYDPMNISVNLDNFFDDGNPRVFVMSDQDFVRLDGVIEVKNGNLRMKKQSTDIVFLS